MAKDMLHEEQSELRSSTQQKEIDQTRRNLTRIGLTTPVLMSFSGYSPLANACATPSRHASGNTSPQTEEPVYSCNGKPPSYLVMCASFGSWPLGGLDAPQLQIQDGSGNPIGCTGGGVPSFDTFFSSDSNPPASKISSFGTTVDVYVGATTTFIPVLPTNGAGTVDQTRLASVWELLAFPEKQPDPQAAQFAQFIIAAIYNANADSTYPVSVDQAKEMFAKGPLTEYQPTNGVKWGVAEIIFYLQSTMGFV